MEKYGLDSPVSQLSNNMWVRGKISIFGQDIVDLPQECHWIGFVADNQEEDYYGGSLYSVALKF